MVGRSEVILKPSMWMIDKGSMEGLGRRGVQEERCPFTRVSSGRGRHSVWGPAGVVKVRVKSQGAWPPPASPPPFHRWCHFFLRAALAEGDQQGLR